ncbi:MAG: hypothetical protein ABSG25_12950 [Bryobacteraceae bacterium]
MKLPDARPLTIRERLRDGLRLANGELGILMEVIAKIAGRAEERPGVRPRQRFLPGRTRLAL